MQLSDDGVLFYTWLALAVAEDLRSHDVLLFLGFVECELGCLGDLGLCIALLCALDLVVVLEGVVRLDFVLLEFDGDVLLDFVDQSLL